ncbi:hypothetical protein ACFWGM_08880 [Streptomyces roseolus]|uniref:hypothetical protein n=1 Tax=Streptomyces roseolus TaxID=67358 RepID=UPI0036306D0B
MPDTHLQPPDLTGMRGAAKRPRPVHDPTGAPDTRFPLDRPPRERLAAEVLARERADGTPPPRADIDQAALALAGHARLLVDGLRRPAPRRTGPQRVQTVCAQAAGLPARPALGPAGVLNPALARARLVVGLHAELDRLRPAAGPTGSAPKGAQAP